MDKLKQEALALPAWVKVLLGIVLFLIGPVGWVLGVAVLVWLNWPE